MPAGGRSKSVVGPYHVLETLGKSADTEWLLGYDLRLLRKVWIRLVPPGIPPVPASMRSVGRVGRLRWLTGRRSPGENWDAFEAVAGRALASLIQTPQPWRQARFWLFDLANEISAAEKDGTLPPVLAMDRVWITDDGRAKLLNFPAPGLPPYEPTHPQPLRGGEQERAGAEAVPLLGGVRGGSVNDESPFVVSQLFRARAPQPLGQSVPTRSNGVTPAPRVNFRKNLRSPDAAASPARFAALAVRVEAAIAGLRGHRRGPPGFPYSRVARHDLRHDSLER